MGAFFTPSEEEGVKRAESSAATLTPSSSDGTLCAAIAEQVSAVASSPQTTMLSLITMWVGPFEVAEMGQKSVGLDNNSAANWPSCAAVSKIFIEWASNSTST